MSLSSTEPVHSTPVSATEEPFLWGLREPALVPVVSPLSAGLRRGRDAGSLIAA